MDFDVIPYEDIVWGECIGGGSFGSVFKGQYLGIDIACKEIHMSTQYDVHKYFEREWRIMRECRHPNIVLFLGLSKEPDGDGRVFIVSEYVPRGNLRSFIRSKTPFPWRLRISFATDVARAVAYLHARQCLHRDLKGENLLITSNDRLKVADFGFARITGRNAEEMRHMTYCGTDGYMSPEIIMGEQFDLPTDVYSLGIIFLEILTRILVGSKVYSRKAPVFVPDGDIVRRRASPGCPPAFIDLALDCCRFAPDERPTMPEVLARLREIEQSLPEVEDTPHVGSLKAVRREGKRPIPIFDRSLSSELAAATVEAQVGEFDEDESIATIDVVVDGKGATPNIPKKSNIPWDEMTSEYTNASEMRSRKPLLGSATNSPISVAVPWPPSDTLESTQILNIGDSGGKTIMPCAYPPSPPYDSDKAIGATCTLRKGRTGSRPLSPSSDDVAVATSSPADTPVPASETAASPGSGSSTDQGYTSTRPNSSSKSNGSSPGPKSDGSSPSPKSNGCSPSPKSTGSSPSPKSTGSLHKASHRFTLIHRELPVLFTVAATLAMAFFPRPGPRDKCDKCPVCTKRVGSRVVLQCDDCGLLVHPRCSATAPKNCLADIGVDP